MCNVLLPPGVYPIEVNKCIKYKPLQELGIESFESVAEVKYLKETPNKLNDI
jgi:hypothetical protein